MMMLSAQRSTHHAAVLDNTLHTAPSICWAIRGAEHACPQIDILELSHNIAADKHFPEGDYLAAGYRWVNTTEAGRRGPCSFWSWQSRDSRGRLEYAPCPLNPCRS